MALVVASTNYGGKDPNSPLFADTITITLDTDYLTGGWTGIAALVKAQIGVGRTIMQMVQATCDDGYLFFYDRSADKLKAFYCDYDAGADGALIECAAGLNALTGLFVEMIVLTK